MFQPSIEDRTLCVCKGEYNESERCPRLLPCTHTICTNCVNNHIEKEDKHCPICRQAFQGHAATDFTINTVRLELLNKTGTQQPKIESDESVQTVSQSKAIADMKREITDINSKNVSECIATSNEIKTVMQDNTGLKQCLMQANDKIQGEVLVRIQRIKTKNRKVIQYLTKRNKVLRSQLKVISSKQKQIEGLQLKVDVGNTMKTVGCAMAEAEDINMEFQNQLTNVKAVLSDDGNMLKVFREEFVATEQQISSVQEIFTSLKSEEEEESEDRDEKETEEEEVEEEDDDDDEWENADINGDEYASSAIPEITQKDITVASIKEMSKAMKRVIKSGRLFAVQDFEGRKRYARISIHNKDRVCMHALREGPVKSNALFINYSDEMQLREGQANHSRLVFIQLRIPNGAVYGNMYIRLRSHGGIMNSIVFLCNGERGPTYLNSKIFDLVSMGNEWEHAYFGDYDLNTGKGGRCITGEYSSRPDQESPWIAGAVTSHYNAMFKIYTHYRPGHSLQNYLGHVEDGLHALTEAIAQQQYIDDVVIGDCGQVLFSL